MTSHVRTTRDVLDSINESGDYNDELQRALKVFATAFAEKGRLLSQSNMAGEKEIRSKIASVKNMQKITSAMEKVAASKIRKAQKQMEASRPYARAHSPRVVGHLAHANPDYKHPYLTEREAKRVGYIVISTDRGTLRRPERQPVQERSSARSRGWQDRER